MSHVDDKNWHITKVENSSKYVFGFYGEPLFIGSYTQCLIVLGSLISKPNQDFQEVLDLGITLAKSISEINIE